MSNQLTKSVKSELYKVVFYQLMILMGFTLILFLLKGIRSGLSAFAGGLAYWLPTLLFIWRVSKHAGAQAAMRFVIVFFTSEALKLFLTGILFLIVINYAHAELGYALIGLIVAIVGFWIASIVSHYQQGVRL